MNIIQMQDDLKGLPDNTLITYMQNPTSTMQGMLGYYPSYLVLGELQRRKDMRERYEAQKEPTSTVAEQLVEETKSQGIASMTPSMTSLAQGGGAPQPQPEMTPDMIASSGVGALPAGNVGQNYAGGGIVAFEDGGEVKNKKGPVIYEDGSEGYIFGGLLGLGGRALTAGRNFLLGKKAEPATYMMGPNSVPILSQQLTPSVAATRGVVGVLKDNPGKTVLGGVGGYYMLSGDPDNPTVVPVADEDVQTLVGAGVSADAASGESGMPKYDPPKLDLSSLKTDDPTQYGRDKMAAMKEFIGEDTVTPRLEERLAKLEAGLTEQKDVAPWMALTEAGLAIAAGESPNAMTNIAQGATRGLKSYTEELKDIRSREEKMFDIDTEIQKAKRAEEVAIGTKGFDSMEAAEARNRTMELEQQKSELQQYESERDRQQKIEAAKISSMYGTPGGYYGFRGQQAINKAILSDEVIQDLDNKISMYQQKKELTQDDIDTINKLVQLRKERETQIINMYGNQTTSVRSPEGLPNFEGYSATQIE